MRTSISFFICILICTKLLGQVDTKRMRFDINPYVQAVTENSATIMLCTSQEAVVSVLLQDSLHNKRTVLNSTNGLINAGDKLHKVKVKGLKPGLTYTYSVMARQLMQMTPYFTYYGDTIYSKKYTFTTRTTQTDTARFIVMSDLHGQSEKLEQHITDQTLRPDFYVFNGDITDNFQQEKDLVERILKPAVELFATDIPFYYTRGNHETRGYYSRRLFNYIETPGGKPYFVLTQGPVHLIMLDVGEDKTDDNKYYYGLADFDAYRKEQTIWLKKQVESEAFKNAKYKIVCTHIPFFGYENAEPIEKKAYEMWGPILEKAGIDLMIAGHTHEFFWFPKERSPANYPVLITDNNQRAEIVITKNGIDIKVRNREGSKEKLIRVK